MLNIQAASLFVLVGDGVAYMVPLRVQQPVQRVWLVLVLVLVLEFM